MNFSYLEIFVFAMNVGFSQNRFSANQIPSFQIPSFVTPRKTVLVLSFPVSCVNRFRLSELAFFQRNGQPRLLQSPEDFLHQGDVGGVVFGVDQYIVQIAEDPIKAIQDMVQQSLKRLS